MPGTAGTRLQPRGRRRAIIPPLCYAGLLLTGVLSGADTAFAQDDDFERALAAQPARRPQASPRGEQLPERTAVSRTPTPAALPPLSGRTKMLKGTKPRPLPRWRGAGVPPELAGLRTMPAATSPEGHAVKAAFDEGRLDPSALFQQIEGPLPLPPGARLLDCPAEEGTVFYTLGVPLSPSYQAGMKAVEEEARRPVEPEDASSRTPYPMREEMEKHKEMWAQQGTVAKRTLKGINDFFLGKGFKLNSLYGAMYQRPSRGGGSLNLNMWAFMQSLDFDEACRQQGYPAPAGPIIRVWYL